MALLSTFDLALKITNMKRIILILCITLQTMMIIAQQNFNERYFKEGMYIFDDIAKITPDDLGLTYEDARIVHFSNNDEDPTGNRNNQHISVQASKIHEDIILYPNPASNIVNIILPNDVSNAKVEIYNLNGQVVLEQQINDTQSKINTNGIINGIYVLKIISANKVSTYRIQIIK